MLLNYTSDGKVFAADEIMFRIKEQCDLFTAWTKCNSHLETFVPVKPGK